MEFAGAAEDVLDLLCFRYFCIIREMIDWVYGAWTVYWQRER